MKVTGYVPFLTRERVGTKRYPQSYRPTDEKDNRLLEKKSSDVNKKEARFLPTKKNTFCHNDLFFRLTENLKSTENLEATDRVVGAPKD